MPQTETLVEEGCGRLGASIQEMHLVLIDRKVDEQEIQMLERVLDQLRMVLTILEGIRTMIALFSYVWRVGPEALLNKPHIRRLTDLLPAWLHFTKQRREEEKAKAALQLELEAALTVKESAEERSRLLA